MKWNQALVVEGQALQCRQRGSAPQPPLDPFKSSLTRLPSAQLSLTAAAWVGAQVALGILPSVGMEAISTSYPRQNELNAKV